MSFQRIPLSPLFPVPQHTRSHSAVTWLLLGNCCLTVIFPLQLILSSVLAYCFIHFLVLFCIFKNLNIFPHQSNTLYRFFFNPNKHWDLLRNSSPSLYPSPAPRQPTTFESFGYFSCFLPSSEILYIYLLFLNFLLDITYWLITVRDERITLFCCLTPPPPEAKCTSCCFPFSQCVGVNFWLSSCWRLVLWAWICESQLRHFTAVITFPFLCRLNSSLLLVCFSLSLVFLCLLTALTFLTPFSQTLLPFWSQRSSLLCGHAALLWSWD